MANVATPGDALLQEASAGQPNQQQGQAAPVARSGPAVLNRASRVARGRCANGSAIGYWGLRGGAVKACTLHVIYELGGWWPLRSILWSKFATK
jgi:hypothetical protein